jgi:hypothetical protein
VTVPVSMDPRCSRIPGRLRPGEVGGEEGNNLMWLLDFKLDFFNDAEAKEKGKHLNFSFEFNGCAVKSLHLRISIWNHGDYLFNYKHCFFASESDVRVLHIRHITDGFNYLKK